MISKAYCTVLGPVYMEGGCPANRATLLERFKHRRLNMQLT